jgi:Tfp pilus assembly protein PilF
VASAPKPPGPRGPRGAKPGGLKPGTQAQAPAGTPEERAKAAAADLAQGTTLMDAGDFGGAVIAFNAALTLDPGNAQAKAGIAEAGERYKASKAEREALAGIQLAFRDTEFTSALRLAYRLPPSVPKSRVDAIKLAGWYNLAVVALRAGECKEAEAHLDEALQLAPSDPDAKKLRELAAHYADAVKDRAFLDHVEALAFRPLPQS